MNNLRNTKSFLLLLNTCAFSFPVYNFCTFFPCIPYGYLVDVTGTCSVSGSTTQCSDYISHSNPRKHWIPTAAAEGRGRGVVCRKKISCPEKQHKTILTISIRMPGYSAFRTVPARQGCLDLLCSYCRHEASSVPWLLVLPGHCWNCKGKSTCPIGYTVLLLQKLLQTFPTLMSRTKFYPKGWLKILQLWRTTSIINS